MCILVPLNHSSCVNDTTPYERSAFHTCKQSTSALQEGNTESGLLTPVEPLNNISLSHAQRE